MANTESAGPPSLRRVGKYNETSCNAKPEMQASRDDCKDDDGTELMLRWRLVELAPT